MKEAGTVDEKQTPMKKQYDEIKKEVPDCLLFFRLGDFYELFDEDAIIASSALHLTLTTRDRNKPKDKQMPMCGVPYHAADSYIGRLLAQGYRIALCDQLEDPATAKGLVKRGIIRIITPGTVTDDALLDINRANYVCAVYMDVSGGAAAFCDVATGEFCVAAFEGGCLAYIVNELGRFGPKEILLSRQAAESQDLRQFIENMLGCPWREEDELFKYTDCAERFCRQFGVERPEELLGRNAASVCACGAVLAYAADTQRSDLSYIRNVDVIEGGKYMELDYSTRRSLELTEPMRSAERRFCLLGVLNHTKTPMGGRMLRSWLERPLLSPIGIKRRLAAVDELTRNSVRRAEIMRVLADIGDIQRVSSRVVSRTALPRDLAALDRYLSRLPELADLLMPSSSALLSAFANLDDLRQLLWRLSRAFGGDSQETQDGVGFLRTGCSSRVDRLREMLSSAGSMVGELEARERERTGIKKLRISYNRLTGYCIEIPNSVKDAQLPSNYRRVRSLANSERYHTPELSELENGLNTVSRQLEELERSYFNVMLEEVAGYAETLVDVSGIVAQADALCSLAEAAARNNYCCPEIDLSGTIDIKDGRHPVVEQAQKDSLFVPNDTFMNLGDDRLAIITGPNMAGKSTYMRQTALIVLMAQIGSFVPAKSATIGIVDRIFTRIGAFDDLAAGQSTFMVEMSEVASILKNATQKSLIILDEIGRGTSTYDGMAIARAVLEHCADRRRLGAKTLFATHYHELTELEGSVKGVRNYYISARKQGGNLIFLRKIIRGSVDESYGIEVAKLAGVPDSVITRARECLDELLESARDVPVRSSAPAPQPELQLSLADTASDEVLDRLRSAALDTMSPIEAMNLLYELKRKLDT